MILEYNFFKEELGMKVLKKNGLGGGLVATLLVVAVLGLFSLTGCSNASGGSKTGGDNSPFLGRWVYEGRQTTSGITVTSTYTWNFQDKGRCSFTMSTTSTGYGTTQTIPGTPTSYKYTVNGNTATLSYSGLTFTITLNSDGNTFSYGGNTYTKQSNTLNDGEKK